MTADGLARRRIRAGSYALGAGVLLGATLAMAAAQPAPDVVHAHVSDVPWRAWTLDGADSASGPRYREVVGASRAGSSIHRRDVRVRLVRLEANEGFARHHHGSPAIVYVIEGVARMTLPAETFEAPAGTAMFVEAEATHELRNAGAGPLRVVSYLWAPGGRRAALGRQSTMIEAVPDFPGESTGGRELVRYMASSAPRARSHVHSEDIAWTTNWTYAESLWNVYRYKPFVRPNLADWGGVAHDDVRMGLQELDPGGMYPAHFHESPEIYVVLEGIARWTVGDAVVEVRPGSTVYTPPNRSHRVVNAGEVPLRWLYFWWAPDGDLTALP